MTNIRMNDAAELTIEEMGFVSGGGWYASLSKVVNNAIDRGGKMAAFGAVVGTLAAGPAGTAEGAVIGFAAGAGAAVGEAIAGD